MRAFDDIDLLTECCKLKKCYGLYLNWYDYSYEDAILAAPFITQDEFWEGKNIYLFDTVEECEKYYDQVVGDDGPTLSNPYNGYIRLYAAIAGPDGPITENT